MGARRSGAWAWRRSSVTQKVVWAANGLKSSEWQYGWAKIEWARQKKNKNFVFLLLGKVLDLIYVDLFSLLVCVYIQLGTRLDRRPWVINKKEKIDIPGPWY